MKWNLLLLCLVMGPASWSQVFDYGINTEPSGFNNSYVNATISRYQKSIALPLSPCIEITSFNHSTSIGRYLFENQTDVEQLLKATGRLKITHSKKVGPNKPEFAEKIWERKGNTLSVERNGGGREGKSSAKYITSPDRWSLSYENSKLSFNESVTRKGKILEGKIHSLAIFGLDPYSTYLSDVYDVVLRSDSNGRSLFCELTKRSDGWKITVTFNNVPASQMKIYSKGNDQVYRRSCDEMVTLSQLDDTDLLVSTVNIYGVVMQHGLGGLMNGILKIEHCQCGDNKNLFYDDHYFFQGVLSKQCLNKPNRSKLFTLRDPIPQARTGITYPVLSFMKIVCAKDTPQKTIIKGRVSSPQFASDSLPHEFTLEKTREGNSWIFESRRQEKVICTTTITEL